MSAPQLPAILDPEHVMRGLGGTMEDYLEIQLVFKGELPNIRRQLEELMPAAESRRIAVLHELANTFGVIGALRAERMCRDHENQQRSGVVKWTAAMTTELSAQLDAVIEAMASS